MPLIFFTLLIISSTRGYSATISCESSSELRSLVFAFDSVEPKIFLKTQINGLPEKTITYASESSVCGIPINFQDNCSAKEDPALASQIGAKYLFSFSCNNSVRGNVTYEDGDVATLSCSGLPDRIIGNCIFKK